jgi:hypothetical protein
MEHRKPKVISRKLRPAKQVAFIKAYDTLMNQLFADEALILQATRFVPSVVGRRKRCRSRWNRAAGGTAEYPLYLLVRGCQRQTALNVCSRESPNGSVYGRVGSNPAISRTSS